ncbi:B12-binding domain-containing radical SAM protein [Haloimpatiens sp. FM7315]|uniref:B12-binding domain-containing radical SAM protein n=1 Tax=Haloimpatiens sp. FM7315 TaxID=3298609 RepID=UPI003977BC73
MKVLLVGINSKFIHSNLAVRYLKSYTSDLEYSCDIMEFSINDLKEKILNKIINYKPDIVGFSTYIWNTEYVSEISRLIKLINKDIKIFGGGPEVSFNGKDVLSNTSMDYVIEGEGEETYREFIKCALKYNSTKDKVELVKSIKDIKGLHSKIDGEIFYGGQRNVMDINNIKFPYGYEDNLENKIVYYEASRGCPFGCKYCLSSVDRKVRTLDLNRVKKELQFFLDKKVTLVKFVDRTFNCKPDWAKEIWKFIIEQDESVKTTFHFEISADLLKEDQIELLKKCPKERIQFEVGVQTTNNNILRNINRHVNFESIRFKVLEVRKLKNIKQHLDLIAGLPGEKIESFKKSFNDVYSMKPEEIQLGFLKLLKGSPMLEEADKWGMVYSPYPPYEILKTNEMSYDEISYLKDVEKVVDKYYNTNKFNNILKYFEKCYSKPYDFFSKLAEFCRAKGYFDRNISQVKYYEVFLEFNHEVLEENNTILNEIIKFDYLLHNKKKWVPPFLDRTSDKDKNKILRDYLKESNEVEYKDFHIEEFKINPIEVLESNKVSNEAVYFAFDTQRENQFKKINDVIEKLNTNENI